MLWLYPNAAGDSLRVSATFPPTSDMLLEILCNVLQHNSEALRETMIVRQSGEILNDTADHLDVLPLISSPGHVT